jgi:hypothetical protein
MEVYKYLYTAVEYRSRCLCNSWGAEVPCGRVRAGLQAKK